jgi:hypothetical protein
MTSITQINQTLSLYIPVVHNSHTADSIGSILQNLGFGTVDRVDMERKGNRGMAFVHFSEWTNSSMVAEFQAHVMDESKPTTIMYQAPFFWKILPNNAPRTREEREAERLVKIAEKEAANRPAPVAVIDHICEMDVRMLNLEEENAKLGNMVNMLITNSGELRNHILTLEHLVLANGNAMYEKFAEYDGCDESLVRYNKDGSEITRDNYQDEESDKW